MKIFVVDPNLLFREGLINLLLHEPGVEVVGEAGSVFEAFRQINQARPHLILLDTELPDFSEYNGIRLLRSQYPQAQIVLMCAYPTGDMLVYAVRNGARGLLAKNQPLSHVLASIHAIEKGEAVVPRAMVGHLLDEICQSSVLNDQEDLGVLTPREMQVLRELGAGGTNRQIAQALDIAENTVKVHVHNILEKLNLRNRRQAARVMRVRRNPVKHTV